MIDTNAVWGGTIRGCSDIVHDIAIDVIVVRAVIGIVDAGSSVGIAGSDNVVDVVTKDLDIRSQVLNSVGIRPANLKTDDIHVITQVLPHGLAGRTDDNGRPQSIRNEAYSGPGVAAYRGDNRARVGARPHVDCCAGTYLASGVSDGAPWCGCRTIVGIIP